MSTRLMRVFVHGVLDLGRSIIPLKHADGGGYGVQ